MNSTFEQVFSEALALAEDDRVELVEALIVSLQPSDQAPLDESWREIIRRRSAELRSGQVTAVPWTEVKRLAKEKAGG